MSDRSQHLISAVHMAVRKLSATSSVEETLREVLELCVSAADTEAGSIYIHNPAQRKLEFRHVLPESLADKLPYDIPDDFGIAGQVFQTRKPAITTNVDESARAGIERETEVVVRSMLTVPLCVPGGDPIGVVQLINKRNGPFTEQDVETFESVGAVSAMATANSILVEHVGRSAGLMGMGNVSHDIANLAGALRSHLYMVDPLLGKIEGALVASGSSDAFELLREALDDLSAGTSRIERYSHLISDLAAGRPVRVSKSAGDLPAAVLRAASYLEPMARRERCELTYEVEPDDKEALFDSLAVHRIVENLVTNAIKAVKEGSEVRQVQLRLRPVEGHFVLEVEDTGPGMSDSAVRRILEGTAVSQWTASSGTGLGTKIVRELVSALGGRMEIESTVGTGTTFRVFIPSERVEVPEKMY